MKILLAVDGSEHSADAAAFLRRLAPGGRHSVTLFYVIPEGRLHETPGAITEVLRDNGRKNLAAMENEFDDSNSFATFGKVAASHDVANAILDEAEKNGAELIVTGARGLSPSSAAFLGSVSRTVFRHAQKPVLISRGSRITGRPLSVLVGVDGSIHSWRALGFVLSLGMPEDTHFTVMYVVSEPLTSWAVEPFAAMGYGGTSVTMKTHEDILKKLQEKGRAALRDAREFLAMTFQQVESIEADGDPASEILEAARMKSPDLIVLGRGDHTYLDRFFSGSVSHTVALNATSSVLIVR